MKAQNRICEEVERQATSVPGNAPGTDVHFWMKKIANALLTANQSITPRGGCGALCWVRQIGLFSSLRVRKALWQETQRKRDYSRGQSRHSPLRTYGLSAQYQVFGTHIPTGSTIWTSVISARSTQTIATAREVERKIAGARRDGDPGPLRSSRVAQQETLTLIRARDVLVRLRTGAVTRYAGWPSPQQRCSPGVVISVVISPAHAPSKPGWPARRTSVLLVNLDYTGGLCAVLPSCSYL